MGTVGTFYIYIGRVVEITGFLCSHCGVGTWGNKGEQRAVFLSILVDST